MGTALCSAWPGLCDNPLQGQMWSNPWKIGMSLLQGLERAQGNPGVSWVVLTHPQAILDGWAGAEGCSHAACFYLNSFRDRSFHF